MISDHAQKRVGEWVETQTFRDVFAEVMTYEIQARLPLLRSLIRQGKLPEAMMLEGEITMLESLPQRLLEISQLKPSR